MNRNINMTKGKPMKLMIAFALPLMVGNIFQQLYTVVDTAIVGRGVGMEALAALGSVDWINWLMLGIVQGFTQGFSVKISQKYGEGDGNGVKLMIGQSAFLSAVIAIAAAVVSQGGLYVFFKIMSVPAHLEDIAELYIRVLFSGLPIVVFYNFCASVLRAVGDSKTPLLAMLVAALTNIGLDCLAVFVLEWGVAGAAAATVAAQLLSGTICAVKMWRSSELHFSREHFTPKRECCSMLIKMGTPIAVKNTIIAAGGMVVQRVVNGFDTVFIAGFIATNKLYGVLEVAALSYSYALTTYMGQNYGGEKWSRIKQGVRDANVLSIGTAIIIAAAMIIFGRDITMLFMQSESPEMVAKAGNTAYNYLVCMSLELPILYLLYAYLSTLQGLGRAMAAMISGGVELVMRVSVAVIVAVTRVEEIIFFAEGAAWCGGLAFLVIYYYTKVHPMIKLQTKFEEKGQVREETV